MQIFDEYSVLIGKEIWIVAMVGIRVSDSMGASGSSLTRLSVGFCRLDHVGEGKNASCRRVLGLTMVPMNRETNQNLPILREMSCQSFCSIALCVVGCPQRQIRHGREERLCGQIQVCRRKG